jgi:hypothetical protein
MRQESMILEKSISRSSDIGDDRYLLLIGAIEFTEMSTDFVVWDDDMSSSLE